MRIVLVENETFWRERITCFLREKIPAADLVFYEKGEDFLKAMPGADLVLMDVEMPGLSGFETAGLYAARGGSCPLIILTTHTEMGREGYKVNAFRYVDKLAMKEELTEALESLSFLRGETERVCLTAQEGGSIFVRLSEIMFAESLGRRLCLHTAAETLLLREPIGQLEELLPADRFFRCHKSFLVGWKYVKNVGECDITMAGGEKIPLTRRKRSQAREVYLEYAYLRAGR